MADIFVCKNAELKAGEMRSIKVGSKNIVVFRDESGELSALEDRCSHADVKLSSGCFKDGIVQCPAHGAKFDIKTGKHLCMPAVVPVRRYGVSIKDSDIVVTVD